MRRDDELGGTEAVIYLISEERLLIREPWGKARNSTKDSPVRLPSSIIRIVIVPSLNLSPAAAGTKFTGTCGTSRRRSCEGGGSRSGAIVCLISPQDSTRGFGLGDMEWAGSVERDRE